MIKINIDKAKAIAHEKRREARAAEFAPHDEVIAKRIPGVAESVAEAARQAIREKYAVIQGQIDSTVSVEGLSKIVNSLS
jgi:hypothetical protein